ncbi:MAG TPA: hypothetical protein VJZ00_08740 [Thermoanaerobaculia bacterium]|nr:hypothetical protein [Thermoanaerobaculia bacterium]
MKTMRFLFLALSLFAAASLHAQFCTGKNHITWPNANPVWDLCWVSPPDSSGPDGSGLEIRHAFYKGHRVFWRANVPVLNVLYDQPSGPCGPTYRDWMTALAPFQANNIISPGYAEPTSTPVTTCDTPGSDPGSFQGVAVERLADRLVLTTQTNAGWYRYVQKWTFFADGRVTPAFGFTAITYMCVTKPHTHHGYWRFDFDIDGAGGDVIRERKKVWFFWTWSTQATETKTNRASGKRWRVQDGAGRGYEITPGTDGTPPDAWAGSDVWLLRYHGNETDDGGATGGANGDAQHIDPYVNGESINGQDVVMWYRIEHRHASGLTCMLLGPTLQPINW